jgi:hypothetical protein
MLNEEILEYFYEARRVLRNSAAAVFSFPDLGNKTHRAQFVEGTKYHRQIHSNLPTFTTREIRTPCGRGGISKRQLNKLVAEGGS